MLDRLGCCVLLLIAGCASAPDATPDPEPKPKPAKHAAAVPSDINETFTDPALDPQVWVERFEREKREVFAHRAAIVDSLALKAGQTVADVGTGTGLFLPLLADKVGAQGKVYALDISPRLHEFVKERFKATPQIEARLSKPSDVELPAGSVDVVFVCDTYHHFEDPAAILATIKRALKPGGQLVVIEFHRIEGVTDPWLFEHVRAGQDVFVAEIEAAGFKRLQGPPAEYLKANYLVRFQR